MAFVLLLAAVFVVLAFREYVQHAIDSAQLRLRTREARGESDFVHECCCKGRKS